MNTFSHIRMAMEINRTIGRILNIRLDTARFVLGNIKPDFCPSLIKIPHLKEASFDFVASEIRELMAQKFSGGQSITNSFSERLGVLTHYLADFFCHAHAKSFTSGSIRHFIYEARLNGFIKRYPRSAAFHNFSGFTGSNADPKSICGFLNRLHLNYESKRPSFARDYIYSLRACTALAVSVVSSCMPAGLELAA